MDDILVIHGVNLSLLGQREKEIYGRSTLDELNIKIREKCAQCGVGVDIFQSNHEGAIVDKIIEKSPEVKVIIIKPGAFTHYSYAIRDCIAGVALPAIEVHLSNIFSREKFRNISVIAPVCRGQISGFGLDSYLLALEMAVKMIKEG